uniref:START domain-containing protein n=1 Tax=viral metagenome TaxID=1070528 RepID=A0A6C0EMZ7_9ZZZZ
MLDLIKDWVQKLNFDLDIEKTYSKDDITFQKFQTEKGRHFYKISSFLNESPEYFFDYIWSVDKIIDTNKNLIKDIKLLEKGDNYQRLETIFSFKSANICINKISRKDIFYFEKSKNIIHIYGKLLEYDDEKMNGYSYIKLKKTVTGGTKIEIIVDMYCIISKAFDMLPGLLIFKNISNLKNIDYNIDSLKDSIKSSNPSSKE